MYPEIMVIPMREELTRLGIEELRTAADVDRVLQSRLGTTMVGEAIVPKLQGKTAYLNATASALRNSRGEVVGAIETIRDTSDSKQAEQELHPVESLFTEVSPVVGTHAGPGTVGLAFMAGM